MKSRPVVMLYCQHVLGMGHFVRSMELVKGLKDFQIYFFNGGEMIPGFPLPAGLEITHLPPLESDAEFSEIRSRDAALSLDEIKQARVRALLEGYERIQSDIFMIELFPFGRKQFSFELVPLLARIRTGGGVTKVVRSLRDILVGKSDQTRHERRVCAVMNRYFDLLLIHADPKFQRLEEIFFNAAEMKTATRYTGYVAQPLDGEAENRNHDPDVEIPAKVAGEPLLLVSVDGGRVGYELLEAAVVASMELAKDLAHRLVVFTGPYLPQPDYLRLEARVADQPQIVLRRFTHRFLSCMQQADLSVSMAGYNTCMNILTTGTRALLWPFTGGGNGEQTVRAEKSAALGAVGVIRPEELAPRLLA